MIHSLEHLSALIAQRFGLRPAARGHSGALDPIAEERRRALGLTLEEYAALAAADPEELWALASRLSNGWTWFFRDRAQLVELALRLATKPGREPLSIWVAGASTGEEAYGLAMLCAERALDVRIVATDLDRARLAAGARGVYDEHAVRAVSDVERARWLEPLGPGSWRVREELRRVVSFRAHNLMDTPPALARFDAVVCRNVLIHATDGGAAQMARGLTQSLAPGGELVLGASDLLQVPPPRASSRPAPPIPRRPASPPLEPVDAIALITMGNVFVEAHAFDRAESAYRRAETLEPCSAELHLAWGVLHRKRGDLERAVSALRRAVFLDETLWPAWSLLAGTLARLGADLESAAAAEQARRARRERPAPAWRSRTDRLLLEQLAPEIRGGQ